MTKPYPFQLHDLKRVERWNGRAIVGWEMGLGKTPFSLWYAKRNITGPIVVICPAIAKEHWRRQARQHIGKNAHVLYGRTPHVTKLPKGSNIWIVNFDILGVPGPNVRTWSSILSKLRPELVIIDECHNIKEMHSQRSIGTGVVCEHAPHILALSGTPLVNRPIELYYVLSLVRPGMFPSRWTYGLRYCALHKGNRGYDYSGASNIPELHRKLTDPKAGVMVRRRKEEVLKDLPELQTTVVPVRLAPKDQAEYDRARDDFLSWLGEKSKHKMMRALGSEGICRITYLKQLVAELKLKIVGDWIDEYLEETGEKLLVFGIHRKVLQPLHERFKKISVLVDGRLTGINRQLTLDQFNDNDRIRLFFGNIIAGGVVWSCTSANNTMFPEFDWVPGNHSQAADRVRGLGRGTGKKNNVWYLAALNTMEIRLCEVLQKKSKIIAGVLDGKDVGDLDVYNQVIASMYKESKRRSIRKAVRI